MECPKCGYMMDAFTTTCPRCARMGAPATQTVTVVQASPQPSVRTAAVSSPSRGMAMTFGLRQLLAIVGGALISIGVFAPAVSIPFMGGVSLMQISNVIRSLSSMGDQVQKGPGGATAAIFFLKIAAFALLLFALVGIVCVFVKWANGLWIAGGGTLLFSLLLIGGYIYAVEKAKAAAHAAVGALGSSGAADNVSFYGVMPLGLGIVILIIGGIVMLMAAALPDPDAV